ncbi:hypothetical protein ACFV6G_32190, partial [Streptomyces lavendulae]|uniref:hypothetical protein n=1 Tax=Streptomyces lavendulae TaxID=1914 RepID=UPI0036937F13
LRETTTEPRPDIQWEALTLAVAADLPVLLWGGRRPSLRRAGTRPGAAARESPPVWHGRCWTPACLRTAALG